MKIFARFKRERSVITETTASSRQKSLFSSLPTVDVEKEKEKEYFSVVVKKAATNPVVIDLNGGLEANKQRVLINEGVLKEKYYREINRKFLKDVYSFDTSVQISQDNLREAVKKLLDKKGIQYKEFDGNLYSFANKGKPFVSCHLDQVKTSGKAVDFVIDEELKTIYAKNAANLNTSLGADDKNGLIAILCLLSSGVPINFVMSRDEESGCQGIKVLVKNEEFISELNAASPPFGIVVDRRGNNEILEGGVTYNYCKALAWHLKVFADEHFCKDYYKVETGTVSDTQYLCKFCECVNISASYFKAHSENEYTDILGLERTIAFIRLVVDKFVYTSLPVESYYKQPYEYTTTVVNRYSDKEKDTKFTNSYTDWWKSVTPKKEEKKKKTAAYDDDDADYWYDGYYGYDSYNNSNVDKVKEKKTSKQDLQYKALGLICDEDIKQFKKECEYTNLSSKAYIYERGYNRAIWDVFHCSLCGEEIDRIKVNCPSCTTEQTFIKTDFICDSTVEL